MTQGDMDITAQDRRRRDPMREAGDSAGLVRDRERGRPTVSMPVDLDRETVETSPISWLESIGAAMHGMRTRDIVPFLAPGGLRPGEIEDVVDQPEAAGDRQRNVVAASERRAIDT